MKRISSKIKFRRRDVACARWFLRRMRPPLGSFCRRSSVAAGWLLCAVTLQLAIPALHSQVLSGPAVKSTGAVSARPSSNKVALIKSFRIIQEKDGPALEILSTNPLSPAIQQVADPPRLIIDFPNARLDTSERRIEVNADRISALRADQFQENPPVARLVVDLTAAREYTFDSAGNRLVVHLGKSPGDSGSSPFEKTVTPLAQSPAPSVAPLQELSKPEPSKPMIMAVRAAGPLAIADHSGSIGSSFTAGADTAVLRLSSGGELHICPGTTVSITASEDRHNLMLGMSAGAIETHITLDASTDLLMTPDFQIKLAGPGEFHYAFSADSQGNTCVRTLPGNTAPAIVDEMLGDRSYHVNAIDQFVFRGGRIDRMDMKVPLECGCPPPRQPVERASSDLPMQNAAPRDAHPSVANTPRNAETSPAEAGSGVSNTDSRQTVGTSIPTKMYVQLSAPLVFNSTDSPPTPHETAQAMPAKEPSPSANLSPAATAPLARPTTQPETGSAGPPPHRSFFRKIGHFVAAMFR